MRPREHTGRLVHVEELKDQQVEVRMPVNARAVRLPARDDARRKLALAGQRTDGGGDGAGGDARDLAAQATTV